MMLRKTILSGVALAVLAVVPALAEDAPQGAMMHGAPGVEHKNPADTDGDGFLSKAEFQVVQDKRFAEMDGNSDGKISSDEMKAHRESKRAEWKEKRQEWRAKKGQSEQDQSGVSKSVND